MVWCKLFSHLTTRGRAITEGHLDVHPTLNAIVVHYQMDAVVVSVLGDPVVADTKEGRKL